ncbi:MAG: ribonuclease HIII [Candidatus Cloacimonetes bacterium]|nr:ribonuclease HIII [Candidatus Cloacimonadota bacterium]
MNKELLDFVEQLLIKTEKNGFLLSDEKEINYGVQLIFSKDNTTIPLNVYHSKKKGISTVIGGSPKNKLKLILNHILERKKNHFAHEHDWDYWIGTDESGKGDFFGPLVVCGFIASKQIVEKLSEFGIKDSKLLKDDEIEKIAKKIYANFPKNIETIVLNPSKYNELYSEFRKQGKKLNELLSWMHARVILNMKKKNNFEGAVVDKFASDRTLIASLKGLKEISLIHKTKAESDPAVAAASIIARYNFLKKIKDLSRSYQIDFPKGASNHVLETGKIFAEKFGKEKFMEVAKLHFRTYNKIEEKL